MLTRGAKNSDKDMLTVKSLLHCRTVIENQNFVATGVMTQVEGELFEVELNEFDRFELGETVKLTIYSPAGIQSFQSMLFAKYDGAVAIIQPPQMNQRFQEKREYYRVEAAGIAQILRVTDAGGDVRLLPTPLEAELRDISIAGLGLLIDEEHEDLLQASHFSAVIEMGFRFACDLEIVRRERREIGYHYGMRMKLHDTEMLRPLRAFLLRRQVEKQIQIRGEREKKRSFGAN